MTKYQTTLKNASPWHRMEKPQIRTKAAGGKRWEVIEAVVTNVHRKP